MELYSRFLADEGIRRPWIVKFEDKKDGTQELQLAGESAQDVIDYVRRTYEVETVYFVAKLDNTWK